MADVYRRLRVGNPYTYNPHTDAPRAGKGGDSRRAQRCITETVPRPGRGPGNVRVRFEDGHVASVPAGVLRKV
jgi:hypothetical protein